MAKLTKTPEQIRDDYLRTIYNGLIDLGVEDPDVSEGSPYWLDAEALAQEVSALFNNIEFSADALLPDTATGTDLDRLLAIFGLSRRSAGTSAGQITIECSAPTLVATGTQLVSSLGVKYQVPTGGTFENGDIIDVVSVDTGVRTNLAVNSKLTWVSPPAFTKSTANVTRAITGGVDQEDDNTARERLLSRLKTPPASGNWQHVAELAEASDPVVQKAFVYPAANGPATLHVCVVGYPSEVSKSRVIDSLKLNAIIIPHILGNLPEYVECKITTVEDLPVDIAVNLTIPLALSSTSSISGPGTGGGWLDATPFPAVNGTTHWFAPVTSVTDSTNFVLSAASEVAPTPGVTRIQWIDRTNWKVKQATITAATGTGPYTLTINSPFVGIAVGDWIFPASVNAQIYLDALLEGTKQMGPGEKTNIAAVFSRAARKPRAQTTYPFTVDSALLRAVNNASEEVQTSQFWYRSTATPAVQGATTVVSPDLPASINDAPKILIPRHIGFYPPYPLE